MSVARALTRLRDLPHSGGGWEVTLSAEDSGRDKVLSSTRTLKVLWTRTSVKADAVEDVVFLRRNYSAVVAEGQPRGAFVLQVSSRRPTGRSVQVESSDMFSPAGRVSYRIVEGNKDGAFELDELGALRTALELDHEIQAEYRLRLTAVGVFRAAPECSVLVRVLNLNDNSPLFAPLPPRRLEEDLPPGALVAQLTARDADPGSLVEYSLSPPSPLFHLERLSGRLLLLAPLDFETAHEHRLSVHAYDGQHAVFTELIVQVLDVNDHAPVFSSDFYEFPAGLPEGAQLGRVAAFDEDSGELGQVLFSLEEPNELVDINATSGVLIMKKALEQQSQFVTVKVSEVEVLRLCR